MTTLKLPNHSLDRSIDEFLVRSTEREAPPVWWLAPKNCSPAIYNFGTSLYHYAQSAEKNNLIELIYLLSD